MKNVIRLSSVFWFTPNDGFKAIEVATLYRMGYPAMTPQESL